MARSKPAGREVATVEAAARGPANEAIAGGKAAQVDDMGNAPPAPFDRAGFIAAIESRVNQQAPKTLEEADGFERSGALASVKDAVAQTAAGKQDAATSAVDSATEQQPDPSRGTRKPGGPLAPQPMPPKPKPVGAAAAMPRPKPPAATDLSAPKRATDREMADAGVTEEQLASSNEPAFLGALQAKQAGEEHSANAPGPVRAAERNLLGAAKRDAKADETAALTGMVASRQEANQQIATEKQGSKSKNEAERAEVAQQLESIYTATQSETKAILDGIDPQVDAAFETGEAAARQAFENKYKTDLDRFKDRRYSGALGWARWLEDKLTSPPPEVGRIIAAARRLYLTEMRKVVGKIADIVGRELTRAKQRVAAGRVQITEYVRALPQHLQQQGAELAQGVQGKLDTLEQDVDAKKDALIDKVATRYKETKAAVDARVEEMKAENMGLWDRAKAAIAGVIQTIIELKNALASALRKASNAITSIIKDPIGFLNNLIAAFKQGLDLYLGNIKKHLLGGVIGWLTGAMGDLDIKLPAKFDLRGIVDLVLQVLGITWQNIRAQIVKRLGPAGASVIGRIEQGIGLIGRIVAEGPIALWSMIVERVTGLWDMVVGKIQSFVQDTIIMQGIQWLMSLINPAAAFVKACKMIIDGVMWLWNNAARIIQLIDTIAGSALSIAKGAIGSAAGAIEKVLGRLTPVLISFLASLLGLGGVVGKVKEIITAVRKPINRVIGKVVDAGVKLGRKLLKSPLGKMITGGLKKAKAWAKKKVDAAKRFGQKQVQKVKQKIYGGDDSPEGKRKREGAGLSAAVAHVDKWAGKKVGKAVLSPGLAAIKMRRGLGVLALVPMGGNWGVEARVDRNVSGGTKALMGSASAPDIGNVGYHGENAGQQRGKGSLSTISEHVVPFAMTKHILEGLGLVRGDRSAIGKPDAAQRTIVIYAGAAALKTPDDNVRSRQFADANADAFRALATAEKLADAGPAHGPEGSTTISEQMVTEGARAIGHVKQNLIAAREDAIERTNAAIANDWESHGQSRGEAKSLPRPGDVRTTAREQVKGVLGIITAWVIGRGDRNLRDGHDVREITELTLAQLNSLDEGGLQQIRRVGPDLARVIYAARLSRPRRRFASVADFRSVPGVGKVLAGRVRG